MHLFSTALLVLQQQPALFLTLAFVLGVTVGSFLNVVIYRLPIMLHNDYRLACSEYLHEHGELPDYQPKPQAKFNLATPDSACPHCQRPIRAWENIPIISFLLMRGRCAGCGSKISWQYPLVELLTGVLTLLVAIQFGVSLQFVFAFILVAALVALSGIDFQTQLLPDIITLPMLWLGLLISLIGSGVFVRPQSAILGAALGYLILWSVFWAFKLLTGKEGMGFGDFKLLAMLGAWLGVVMLPQLLLISAVLGAVVGIFLMMFKNHSRQTAIAFGPYIAIAGMICLLFGNDVNQLFWQL